MVTVQDGGDVLLCQYLAIPYPVGVADNGQAEPIVVRLFGSTCCNTFTPLQHVTGLMLQAVTAVYVYELLPHVVCKFLFHVVHLSCRMVDAGEIFAEIDASAGMVRFLEDPEQYTSSGALQHLNTTIQASFSLAQQLQAVNTQVICLRQLMCCGTASK